MLIEVFRAGSPAAAAAGITASDLDDVAAFDCANNPVPNVIGHPASNSPANGRVGRFERRGDSLFAEVPAKLPAFKPILDGIRDGSILNRSMAFFPKNHPSNPTPGKLAPRHLGYLGGAAPGIAGMQTLEQAFGHAFAADDDEPTLAAPPADAVMFTATPEGATGVVTATEPAADPSTPTPTPAALPAPTEEKLTMTPEELKAAQDKLAADQAEHARKETEFAARETANRAAANASAVDGLVRSNKVLPADRDDLVAAFNAVDGGDLIAFASDANKAKASPVSIITSIMAKGGAATPANGEQLSPTTTAAEFSASDDKAAAFDKARADRLNKFDK